MTSIEKMFDLAIELRDNGELNDAVKVFLRILDNYSNDNRIVGVYGVLAGIYFDLEEYDKALENFKKATDINPKSELASLGLYLTYAKLYRDIEAIGELIRYLRNYPAKLYMDTFEELLVGLEKGYMTNFKDEIIVLAKKNGVEIIDSNDR